MFKSSAVVAILTFLVLLGSASWLPMVWDEGNAIRRSDRIAQWFADGPAFSHESIQQGWPYTTQVEGHPAFYGVVIVTGHALSSSFLSPLTAARFGPICLFALAAGVVFWRVFQLDWNGSSQRWVAASGAIGAMLLLPRLFAHVHFASFDGPLTSCWLLAWAFFDAAVRRKQSQSEDHAAKFRVRMSYLLFGLTLGMTLSCKATGWLAPVPFIVWTLCYRDRQAAKCLGVGLPIALLIFFVLNPPLWLDPVDGFLTFLRMNFHRDELGLNLSTQFLGHLYNLDHPLPWYNTLFWAAVTVPVPLLILLAEELVAIFRHPLQARFEMLIAMNAAILLIVRALPGVPVHDGVRLFLPSFAFIAVLIGCGAARLWVMSKAVRLRWLGPTCVILFYLGAASSLLWFAPHWLSYYNLLIGGPSGAAAVGLEPTYYWDSLDDSVFNWLNEHTASDEKVLFVAGPTENLALLQKWGKLQPDYASTSPGRYRWCVIQNRPGALQSEDLRRLREETPAYHKNLGDGGIGPWRRDVLILGVYPVSDP